MKNVRINRLLLSPKVGLLAIVAAVLLLGVGFWYWHSSRPASEFKRTSSITDDQVAEDLATLENAILTYKGKPGDPLGTLPQSLNDLEVKGLHGKLNEYSYHVTQQAVTGAPGVGYEICAYFTSESTPSISNTFAEPNPKAYKGHKAGKQCFENSYYEGDSHINPIR